MQKFQALHIVKYKRVMYILDFEKIILRRV